MDPPELSPVCFDRIVRAVERVRERLRRATTALQSAGVPHAIIGGHAVAAWVSRVDEAATRNTLDVDILLRRADLRRAVDALADVGFANDHAAGIDILTDGVDGQRREGQRREGIHLVFAGEKIRPDDEAPAPDVDELAPGADPGFPLPTLEALVRMKLTAFRLKDRVHLVDLIDVGLVDADLADRLPPGLADRLRKLLDDPDA